MSHVALAEAIAQDIARIKSEIAKRIVGQHQTIDLLLMALFAKGHCLLEGVPGLAKTKLVQSLAAITDLEFKRIQFTPDLMPSDIIGSELLDAQRQFVFSKGPVFANLILADEINRTPPKTQSALLEAMQEAKVSVAGQSHELPQPFLVLATQNPIEQEGTYPLPEAQLDRFLFMITVEYPSFDEEVEVLRMTQTQAEQALQTCLRLDQILAYQALLREVPVPATVLEYAVQLVHKTRPQSDLAASITKELVQWGAGPRASQSLIMAAKARALMQGRFSPNEGDVKAMAVPVLQHRILLNYKAESRGIQGADFVRSLLEG